MQNLEKGYTVQIYSHVSMYCWKMKQQAAGIYNTKQPTNLLWKNLTKSKIYAKKFHTTFSKKLSKKKKILSQDHFRFDKESKFEYELVRGPQITLMLSGTERDREICYNYSNVSTCLHSLINNKR